MSRTIDFHGWHFVVDPERTREAYASILDRGAHCCSCLYCKNFVAQRECELPEDIRSLFNLVGIDPLKDAEVWQAGPLEGGYTVYGGWWHFIGEVVTEGETPIRLKPVATGLGRDWEFVFLDKTSDLKLSSLPTAPLVSVQMTVWLPWVLKESFPSG